MESKTWGTRALISIALAALVAAGGTAIAQGRGGAGGGGHGGGPSAGGPPSGGVHSGGTWHGDGGGWHGGGWHGGGDRWHGSVGVYVGPSWGWGWPYGYSYYGYPYGYPYYGYPYFGYPYYAYPYRYSPYYGYPDDYPSPAYVPEPRVYIERTPQAAPSDYWYYCTDPAGYYPYVKNCSRPWRRVLPQDVTPGTPPATRGGGSK